MTDEQWEKLVAVIKGRTLGPLPVGFIIDSPWLPGWAGITVLDYFTNERMWLEANLKAVQQFPDVIFLPGFWAEYGMCTEPSSFGAKCRWYENELPFPGKVIADIRDVKSMVRPNPKTDGLLPFVLNHLKHWRPAIEQAGHRIRFAVSRGPLNIASFLVGTSELLMAIRTNPAETRTLLQVITDFIIDWLHVQAETFSTIDGIFILDDIVGFLGEADFTETALPYLERIFQSLGVTVKFFHNDAEGLVCAPYLERIGVNLFNFSFRHSLPEMKQLTNNAVTLLGNIAPLEILSSGTPQQVCEAVRAAKNSVGDKRRIILSCGGGMPPGVSAENIEAFLSAAED